MNGSGVAPGWALRGVGLAIVLSVFAVGCGGDGDDGDAVSPPSSQQSQSAADGGGATASIEIELADGTTAMFGDVADGRPLVLNFFASWCAPCRAEMPDFAAVHGDVGDQVTFLGLALQDSDEASAELVELTGVAYPWGFDRTGEIFASFDAFQMPTTVYVSADGAVVGTESGAISDSRLRDRLTELFGVDV